MRNRASTGAVQQISSWAIKHGEIEAEAAEEIIQTDFARNQRKCRSCESTDHFYQKCPQRFYQACGGKGHDAWSQTCPKYQ